MTDSKRTLLPETAAQMVGLSVDELLKLASEGKVPMATLAAFGWRFSLEGVRHLADRLARSGPEGDDGRAA